MEEIIHTMTPAQLYAAEMNIRPTEYVDYKPTRRMGYTQCFDDRTMSASVNGEDSRGIAIALESAGIHPLIARRNKAIPWGLGNRCAYVPIDDRGAALKIINELTTEI